jgi:predicted transcriptional regulator
MEEQLRLQVLMMLGKRHGSGSADIMEDVEIAHELGAAIEVIQEQLDILENQRLVHLYKGFGPSYAIEITPQGLFFLEQVARSIKEQEQKRPLGFKTPGSAS